MDKVRILRECINAGDIDQLSIKITKLFQLKFYLKCIKYIRFINFDEKHIT